MKLYEKILIGIVLWLFGIQFLPDFPGKLVVFSLATWLLAFSYLIGGFLLLNPKDTIKNNIPIIAGLVFGTSLFVLPLTIRIHRGLVFELLPLLNAVLFLGLGIYLFIKRKKKNKVKQYKGIFIRSAIILVVVGFFSFTPVSFKPYRSILITINKGDDNLVNNMQMFNYMSEFEDALKIGDCDRAIEYAKKSNEAGLVWLGISSVEEEKILDSDSNELLPEHINLNDDDSKQNRLLDISGTFSNLYRAYKCKADEYYNNGMYEQALNYYLEADKALNSSDHYYEAWEVEKAYSLNQMALSYKKLYNYDYADSLFVGAIEKYKTVKNTTDNNVATFYSNLAESMAEQRHIGYSNLFYKKAILILEKNTNLEEYKKDIAANYLKLINNHLQVDSLEQAKFFIEEAFERVDKTTAYFCNTQVYYGLYFYKLSNYQKADEIFTACLNCYNKILEPEHQNIAEIYLALTQVKLALAEYELAKNNLDKGRDITSENSGKDSERYANYLKVSANLNKLLGNYEKSEQEYNQVIETYIKVLGERNHKLPEVLSGLANLEISLAKFDRAKVHSESSIAIAREFMTLENPGTTSLLNNAADVNYQVGLYNTADSLYRKTININEDYGMHSIASTATALNGLGLVKTAQRKYKKADSFFVQALKLHKEIFTEHHPFTAVVYLNYANLKIEENKLIQAKEMLNKSLDINNQFFNQEHDIFAYINEAFGDLALKERRPELAKEYYQKALEIYLDKFDEEHIRVKLTRKKLKE